MIGRQGEKLVAILIVLVSVFCWAGYELWYKDSEFRAARFHQRFASVAPGQSFADVTTRLGKPTHYCDIFNVDMTQVEPDPDVPGLMRYKRLNQSGRYELYVIGPHKFVVEFDYQPAASYGAVRAVLVDPKDELKMCGSGNEYK